MLPLEIPFPTVAWRRIGAQAKPHPQYPIGRVPLKDLWGHSARNMAKG
jgi:hypothetical protein